MANNKPKPNVTVTDTANDSKETVNKRYYFLKFEYDFFDQKEIKTLLKMDNGHQLVIIYQKMLLKSLDNITTTDGDGVLLFEGYGEDFAEDIAIEIDEDKEKVKTVVEFLKKVDLMIQTNADADEYVLLATREMLGSETASTRRSRKCRAKKVKDENNQQQCNADATPVQRSCSTMATKCNGDIERDVYKEKECMYSKTEDEDTHRDTIGNSDFNSNSKCSVYTDDDGNTYTDDYYDDVPPPDDDYFPPNDSNGGFFLYYDEEHDNDTLDTKKDKGNDNKVDTTNTTKHDDDDIDALFDENGNLKDKRTRYMKLSDGSWVINPRVEARARELSKAKAKQQTVTEPDYWQPNPNRPTKDKVREYMVMIAKNLNKDIEQVNIDDEVREFYNKNDNKTSWPEKDWRFWVKRWVDNPMFGNAKPADDYGDMSELERILLNTTYVC